MSVTATILQTSDLKKRAGKILDAARQVPQFIIREGRLFKITLTELPVAPQNPPPGYFNEPVDPRRTRLEAAYSRLPQAIDR